MKRVVMILGMVAFLLGLAGWFAHAQSDEPAPIPLPDVLLMIGRPKMGERLFNTFQEEAGFSCASCHRADSEQRLIGPGLLNIGQRAGARVPNMSAAEYLYTSIIAPSAHVVEGYPDGLMPANWAEVYNLEAIADIMAYLVTLEGESPIETSDASASASADLPDAIVLPADASAERGAQLFTTFQQATGFACSTCHRADSEQRLIGPGLLNVGVRAQNRVAEQDAVTYLYTSIVQPDAYIVDGFSADLMPENWAQVYSEADLYDIIAYLLTLQGE